MSSNQVSAEFLRQRRLLLTRSPEVMGLDYVTAETDPLPLASGAAADTLRWHLVLHFVPAPEGARAVPEMTRANINLRSPDCRRDGIRLGALEPPERNTATLHLEVADISEALALTHDPRPWTLELVDLPEVDRFFTNARLWFSSAVDRRPAAAGAKVSETALPRSPEIDYLAKDYQSFLTLMRDRLAFLVPDWKERNPADLGIAILEVLAYAGDYLSYHQDATATEAYLQTARRRVSIRRLGRLVDYYLGEGRNARMWVHVEVAARPPKGGASAGSGAVVLPRGSQLLTRVGELPKAIVYGSDEYGQAVAGGTRVFETAFAQRLYPAQNRMLIYTWGASEFTLPEGATSASLVGHGLDLRAGDLVCFEQIRCPKTGRRRDADPGHRHTVRLAAASVLSQDPLNPSLPGAPVTEIRWFEADALPFPLPVAARVPRSGHAAARANDVYSSLHAEGKLEYVLPAGATSATLAGYRHELEPGDRVVLEQVRDPNTGRRLSGGSKRRHPVRLASRPRLYREKAGLFAGVAFTEIQWLEEDALPFPLTVAAPVWRNDLAAAFGNNVLADEGQTVVEDLAPVVDPLRYHPSLAQPELTFRVPPDPELLRGQPAKEDLLTTEPVLPAVALVETAEDCLPSADFEIDDLLRRHEQGEVWLPRLDLLESDRFARNFVVEMDDERRAWLRFGDGHYGRAPAVGTRFRAYYRIGSGPTGNIGYGSIAHVITDDPRILSARNPESAVGGTLYQKLDEARLVIPTSFHSQRRCVTESDFETAAERLPGVFKAIARLRWTGSWTTAFVHVQRADGELVDDDYLARLERSLKPLLIAGYDLALRPPEWTALRIVLELGLEAGQFDRAVQSRLMDSFSDRRLPDGGTGFFYPGNFTFGKPVYLSDLIERASQVSGAREVVARTFSRLDGADASALERGYIKIGDREIVTVHNDPRAPQLGTIDFRIGIES